MALEAAIARESNLQSGPWLRNQRWDLTFIILSISLVAVPLIMFYQLGVPVLYVNLLVALVVGGPHMYSTYTVSFLEPNFRRRYPLYAGIAFLIPIAVIYLAVANLTLLLTVFFFWASVHVLHQISFFVDCYREKGGHPEPLWSRLVDYGVVFTCLYPIAMYKLVRGEFIVENRPMLIPEIFRTDLLVWLAGIAFGVAMFLFIARTVKEVRERRVNVPKTLLISLTAIVSFFVPAVENIEVAFQGMNTWHSFQYLALIWYMNALRKQHGEIGNSLVKKISGEGRSRYFYLFNMGVTVAAGAVIGAIALLTGAFGDSGALRLEQVYYIVVLSSLLVHYYIDHFLFTKVDSIVKPGAAQSPALAAG